MCSRYWNLTTKIICPNCSTEKEWNLTTHFMGDRGSCLNTYSLNEKVPELEGVDVFLDGRIDDFLGDCPSCAKIYSLGGKITKGKVTKVWILEEIIPRANIVKSVS